MPDVITRLRYLYDPTGINQAVAGTQRLEGANAKAASSFGLMGAAASAGVFALGAAVVGGIGASIKAAASFEQQMNVLQAVTGATAEEIGRLDKRAVELGADLSLPATSALDAAKAMTELSKAGLSVQNTLDAAKGTLQLAAAANVSEARAAEIASNALNAFSLDGSKATKVADLLAASANASSGEITDMADAMQMSSAVFASLGFNIEELTTAIGLMANRGIQGSDAGTSLKQAMLALINPTAKAKKELANMGVSIRDETGAIKPLRTLINEFTTATGKMGNAQRDTALDTIFGSDAIRAAFTVMTAGTDQYDKMFEAVTKVGAAEELATARTKGLAGAWDGLKSQLETLGLVAGRPLLAGLTRATRGLSSVVGFFANQLIDTNSAFMRFARSARTAVGPALMSAGRQFLALSKYVGTVIRDGDTLNDFLADMSPAFRAVAYVIGTTITQLQALGNAIMEIARSPIVRWIGDLIGGLLRLAFGVREGSSEFRAMIAPMNLAATALTGFIAVMAIQTVLGFTRALAGLALSILTFPLRPFMAASQAIMDFVGATAGLVGKAVTITANVITRGAELAGELFQTITQFVKRTGDKFLGPDDLADKTQTITQKVDVPKEGVMGAIDRAFSGLALFLGGIVGGALTGAFRNAFASAGLRTAILTGISGTAAFITAPLTLIIGGLLATAFVSGLAGIALRPQITKFMTDFNNTITPFRSSIIKTFKDLIEDPWDQSLQNLGFILAFSFGGIAERIGRSLSQVDDAFVISVRNWGERISTGLAQIGEAWGISVDRWGEIIDGIPEFIRTTLIKAASRLVDGLSQMDDAWNISVARWGEIITQSIPAFVVEMSGIALANLNTGLSQMDDAWRISISRWGDIIGGVPRFIGDMWSAAGAKLGESLEQLRIAWDTSVERWKQLIIGFGNWLGGWIGDHIFGPFQRGIDDANRALDKLFGRSSTRTPAAQPNTFIPSPTPTRERGEGEEVGVVQPAFNFPMRAIPASSFQMPEFQDIEIPTPVMPEIAPIVIPSPDLTSYAAGLSGAQSLAGGAIDAISSLLGNIPDLPVPDASGFLGVFTKTKRLAESTVNQMSANLEALFDETVTNGVSIVSGLIRFFANDFVAGIRTGVNRAVETLGSLISGFRDTFNQLISSIVDFIGQAQNTFGQFRPWDAMSGAFSTLISNAGSFLDDFLGLLSGAVSAAGNLWDQLTQQPAPSIPAPIPAPAPYPVYVPAPSPPPYEQPPETGQEGFQTLAGQFRRIPGAFSEPTPIIAHGQEIIGRPSDPFQLSQPDTDFTPSGDTTNNVTINISGPFTGPITVTNDADVEQVGQTIAQKLLDSLEGVIGQGTAFPHALNMRA